MTKEVRMFGGEKSLFNKQYWENWTATCKRMKLEYSLTPYTEINSKWIKDLNIRLDTIKLLEENIHWTLSDVNHSNIFFDVTLKNNENKKAYFYLFIYLFIYLFLNIFYVVHSRFTRISQKGWLPFGICSGLWNLSVRLNS